MGNCLWWLNTKTAHAIEENIGVVTIGFFGVFMIVLACMTCYVVGPPTFLPAFIVPFMLSCLLGACGCICVASSIAIFTMIRTVDQAKSN